MHPFSIIDRVCTRAPICLEVACRQDQQTPICAACNGGTAFSHAKHCCMLELMQPHVLLLHAQLLSTSGLRFWSIAPLTEVPGIIKVSGAG